VKHWDEARGEVQEALRHWARREAALERVLLIDDIFGKLRLVVWVHEDVAQRMAQALSEAMEQAGGPFWSGELVLAGQAPDADREVYENLWREAHTDGTKLGVVERLRSKGFWARALTEPPWPSGPVRAGQPNIIAFYSFKGGVGRTTALAAFALEQAQQGRRSVVVDLDLDAPGAGMFLSPEPGLPGARWGVADYLLEQYSGVAADLGDYYHACRWHSGRAVGGEDVLVIPAGNVDENYLGKIARIDLEPPPDQHPHPLARLLEEVRTQLEPQWILLDCRAGLSDAAGFALSGMAHLYVLFGTASEQSWRGLRLVLERLGAQRVRQGKAQAECLLVQALVPPREESARTAWDIFLAQADDSFSEHYYAADPEDPEEDRYWYVRDKGSDDAPHVPIPIRYSEALAHLQSVHEAVGELLESNRDYRELSRRIESRFLPSEQP